MRQAQRSLLEARNRHEEAWREFHAANPHVADALARRALRAKRRGYRVHELKVIEWLIDMDLIALGNEISGEFA